jgi:hypothetical protein
MKHKLGGGLLLAIAAFMLLGVLRSDAAILSATGLVAVGLTVALPAFFGMRLLRGGLAGSPSSRMADLRQQTIEAEILRLAMARQGRLTEVEVSSALALPAGEAKLVLDALVAREVADLEVTDAGVLVYTFHDARYFGTKHDATRLLDG